MAVAPDHGFGGRDLGSLLRATMADLSRDAAALLRECDLYRRLLDLGQQTDPTPFLRDALTLIVEITDARQGYLELSDDEDSACPLWWIAHGLSDDEVAGVRATISRGIMAEAIASGRAIATPSALTDPRFKDRESVQRARIEAVLCAPIGEAPPRGVLYLQGAAASGLLEADARTCVETFSRHLAPLTDRVLAEHRRRSQADPLTDLRKTLRLEGVVGRSQAFVSALEQIALVAPLDVSVLLTGDSGTGKTLLAQIIHQSSPRARHQFVEVNCGALPETLVENELFGAVPGGHSTAMHRVEGKVTAAEHGTLFLDDIGALPLPAQTKLLQLLQSKQYYPLGAAKPVHADIRLIAATNTDLARAVAERRFRDDLFYRLEVLPVRVPSLRERHPDVRELAAFFAGAASRRHGLPLLELAPSAIRALEAAEWPGNARQLEHAVEAAVIRAAGGGAAQIEATHLFPHPVAVAPGGTEQPLTFQEATRRFQARLLRETLASCGWNVVDAARRLDVARSHVYNLIRAFGIERE